MLKQDSGLELAENCLFILCKTLLKVAKMEFREYNNFQFASNDYLTETVQPQLDRLRRTTSVVLFRHGHRTPFKYRNTNDTKYTCYLESNFFSNLDPGWFEGKAEMMYDDVEICSYSTCEPIELNLQFDLK